MSRFHQRGRPTDWSDGRPAGFRMKLDPKPARPAHPGDYRMSFGTFFCIALSIASLLYFGGQLLRPLMAAIQ